MCRCVSVPSLVSNLGEKQEIFSWSGLTIVGCCMTALDIIIMTLFYQDRVLSIGAEPSTTNTPASTPKILETIIIQTPVAFCF